MRAAILALLRSTGLIGAANRVMVLLFGVKKSVYRLAGKSDIEAVYGEGFFRHIEEMTEPSAPDVVEILRRHFGPRSVIDIGCGTGIYLRHFRDGGASVLGVEGSPKAAGRLRIAPDEFVVRDLREGYTPPHRFDLCLCFEVAEHLPPEAAPGLVALLAGTSDTIAFTASEPGQGGTDHLNEQPRDYWIRLFAGEGYRYDAATTDTIRRAFRERKVLWYLPQNFFVFRHPRSAAAGPAV